MLYSFFRLFAPIHLLLCALTMLAGPVQSFAASAQLPEGSDYTVDGGEFTVTDERASDEISETSRLYLNGHLAQTFHLDLTHNRQDARLTVPAGVQSLHYTLCGTITVTRNGHNETHEVSSEGRLHMPNGHHYDAVGTQHFSDFFLVDYDDPDAAEHIIGKSAFCASPNS